MKKLLTIVAKLCSRGLNSFVENRLISELPDFKVRFCCDEWSRTSLFQPRLDEPSTRNKDKPGRSRLPQKDIYGSQNSSSISTISVL